MNVSAKPPLKMPYAAPAGPVSESVLADANRIREGRGKPALTPEQAAEALKDVPWNHKAFDTVGFLIAHMPT